MLRVSVKRGPDNRGWRMRMGKCGWKKKVRITKKVRGKKREMRMAKKIIIIKQTKERNLSFKSMSHGWTLYLHKERDANSWHSFVPCNSFH